jgi:radical SAM-linked protein
MCANTPQPPLLGKLHTKNMRLRLTFSKTDAMRFTSHLDLHKTWERTFRRAGLPLAYSQGFNPHPHINLASALPLGFTGDNDVVDVWLEREMPIPEVQTALDRSAPPGLKITKIEVADDRAPTLQTQLQANEFILTFLEPVPDMPERVEALLAAAELPRERRGKPYDLRPLILELRSLPGETPRWLARLTAREGATGRPEEVLLALGIDPLSVRVHRTRLVFSD